MTTTAFPTSVCGSVLTSTRPNSTPASRSFWMIAAFSEIANHDVMDAAMTPPTPSTADKSSAVAFAIASSEPNSDASDSAAAGPRFFIPRAVSNLGNGRDRDD